MLFCHNQQVPNPRNSQLYGQRKHNDERVDEEMKSLCKEEIGWQWGVSAGLVGTEGVLFRVSLSPPLFFCLFFWDVGWGARSHRPVLVPLQGSSLNLIYIRDANRTDTLAEYRQLLFYKPKVSTPPHRFAKSESDILVGILKRCCRAKMGAAYLIRYHALNYT